MAVLNKNIFVFLPCLLLSCTHPDREAVFTAHCGEHTLHLEKVSSGKGECYVEILYDDEKISNNHDDGFFSKTPYEATVYGTAEVLYFDTIHPPSNGQDTLKPLTENKIIFYMSPRKLTLRKFRSFSLCAQANLAAIQKAIDQNFPSPDAFSMAGIVYGNKKDFTARYESDKNNAIEIAPDGSIVHINKDRGMTFYSTNGLGESVAPGRRIAIEDTNQITMQQIKAYRNIKTGRSITADFAFYYDLRFKSR